MIIIVFSKFFKCQLSKTAVNQPQAESKSESKKGCQKRFLALLHQHSLSLLEDKAGDIFFINKDVSTEVKKKEKKSSAYKSEV